MKRVILAIDGGGVRGIVAAVLLDALNEERAKIGAHRPLSECFDLIAGTSTGAIVAAGLAAPNDAGDGPRQTPDQLRGLYRNCARVIFPWRFWCRIPILGRISQLFGPLYSPAPLMSVLQDVLGSLTFAELRHNLIISSYAIDPREAVFYRGGPDYQEAFREGRMPDGATPPANGVELTDAVTGSTAAPTFFPPHRITDGLSGRTHTVIDGGVFMNNPALLAYADARMLYPDDEIHVVSIGTGRLVDPYPFEKAKNWGFFEWLSPLGRFRTPLISAFSDGQARAVDAQMKKLLAERYHRFDYDLERGYGSPNLDDASKRNMKRLEAGAVKMVEELRPALRALAQQIG